MQDIYHKLDDIITQRNLYYCITQNIRPYVEIRPSIFLCESKIYEQTQNDSAT